MQKLKKTFSFGMEFVSKEIEKFSWQNINHYADWSAQTYYYVCHSTRLLALASANFNLTQNSLHYRFVDHIKEEKAHENLCLKDIEGLGEKLDHYFELPTTKNFYQTQYFQIEHISPLCFFGYILMLEGAAVHSGPKALQKVREAHGTVNDRFWRVHADEDVGHLDKAFSQIKNLDPEQIRLIENNFLQSCYNYSEILRSIKDRSENSITLKSA